jgi:tRNA(Ile)-lysidine synthase TilS/MesJ
MKSVISQSGHQSNLGREKWMRDEAPSAVRVCARCVLPETFPGIRFNKDGICNLCLDSVGVGDHEHKKLEYREKFEALIKEYRGSGAYDVLVCYSGGKDSTHTLAILKEEYKLNILAVSVDNGFVPAQTYKNIQAVVEKLGVDHIYFKPRFDTLAKVFRHCVTNDIFPRKAMERASNICTSCIGIVKYSTLRIALERNIPLIAYGWSPGQAPVTLSIIKNTAPMAKLMQQSLYNPLYKIAGDEIRPYFLEDKHFEENYRFPYYVHPLAFLEYNEEAIYRNILRLGWEPPNDTDANSTNCLLNSFAKVVHEQRLNFHPYALEMANLVREGYLDRKDALSRLNKPDNPEIVAMVRNKLALDGGRGT